MMRDFYAIDQYPFEVEGAAKNIDRFTGNDELGRIFMVRHDHEIVGYIILTFGFSFEYGGRDAFIDELFLEENYRGQGIGKVVMELTIAAAKVLSVQAIHLEVETHNDQASKLYTNQGFESNNRKLLSKRL